MCEFQVYGVNTNHTEDVLSKMMKRVCDKLLKLFFSWNLFCTMFVVCVLIYQACVDVACLYKLLLSMGNGDQSYIACIFYYIHTYIYIAHTTSLPACNVLRGQFCTQSIVFLVFFLETSSQQIYVFQIDSNFLRKKTVRGKNSIYIIVIIVTTEILVSSETEMSKVDQTTSINHNRDMHISFFFGWNDDTMIKGYILITSTL
eukprot:TRINITY_DN2677_c2_g2_i1.p3 TRINITY_DN2677_c2_g2~~TRINITY_DN2677_c2_g2_i1.p3  ORF type:complete len:202 (+),score=-9.07 TRINITY_DN2677_c2_g2_i1:158-763(+)